MRDALRFDPMETIRHSMSTALDRRVAAIVLCYGSEWTNPLDID
jgi:hypothetical protein